MFAVFMFIFPHMIDLLIVNANNTVVTNPLIYVCKFKVALAFFTYKNVKQIMLDKHFSNRIFIATC